MAKLLSNCSPPLLHRRQMQRHIKIKSIKKKNRVNSQEEILNYKHETHYTHVTDAIIITLG